MVRSFRVPYHRGRFIKLRGFASTLRPPSVIVQNDEPDVEWAVAPADFDETQAAQPIMTERVVQPVRDCMDLTGMDEAEIETMFAPFAIPKPSLI